MNNHNTTNRMQKQINIRLIEKLDQDNSNKVKITIINKGIILKRLKKITIN